MTIHVLGRGLQHDVWGWQGWPARASAGTSATIPQKPPTQIGKIRVALLELDPDTGANLRHNERPICLPAIGTQGIAHEVGSSAETSGTMAWMRPICSGSRLLITVPRYLPKYCLDRAHDGYPRKR